ncbi:response regulator, partial [Allosphingosinicella sp.]|uniref:response regulator n=1 Tax=Allosphingosinicella sp. TaxID=2823234 RepID=UPI002F196494
TVDSLADARNVIENEQLDLVLTDIKLRGDGDGTDVARIAGSRNVPVLFVTGACPEEAPSLGIGCLGKPYSSKVLRSALECIDEMLQGNEVNKLPPGLSLYERA